MQTSYSLISSYKSRISSLDRQIQKAPPPPNNNTPPHQQTGPVAYRKLLHRFQKYLAEEERFWSQLIIRLQRLYALEEAQPALVSLGILSTAQDGNPIEPEESREAHQFPPEQGLSDSTPLTAAQRQVRLSILSKALTCLGDISRYKEQYNESGGRSRVGHDDMPAPAKRGRRRGPGGGGHSADNTPRPRNYTRAKKCYQQSRLLVPTEGNPSHQLAILATYEKDWFASIAHCYRALCVAQPYETASNNLSVVMNKVHDLWKRKGGGESRAVTSEGPAKLRIDEMTEKFVVLHAIWREDSTS